MRSECFDEETVYRGPDGRGPEGFRRPGTVVHALGLVLLVALATLGTVACGQQPADDDAEEAAPEDTMADAKETSGTPDPWALPDPPPKSVYDGPLFTLSHDYPESPPEPLENPPWRQATDGGPITPETAEAYVQALKGFIASDMETLLFDYADWDPGAAGWYNQPWLADIRDPIHGSYVGSSFPPAMFPQSGLSQDLTTHVAVYYDEVAASSLQRVWGSSGLDPIPGIESGGAQFPEGSIIVKPAYGTVGGAGWPPIEGAQTWQIYASPGTDENGNPKPPELLTVYLFQFDIIVKDSVAAPETGWVFSTLVYDGSVDGSPWDQMVPLGAQWGNDPDVDSPEDCNYLEPGSCPTLAQSWVNQDTPVYARETLGWGGRLSGPNDGSVDIAAVVQAEDGSLSPYDGRYAMSSCMACHGAAEYEMESFLLPSPAKCEDDACTPTFATCDGDDCKETPPGPNARLVYYQAGSPDFMRWFQSRPGTEPMDSGATALDYGMNYAFKSLPAWYKATQGAGVDELNFVEEFNNYRGRRYEAH